MCDKKFSNVEDQHTNKYSILSNRYIRHGHFNFVLHCYGLPPSNEPSSFTSVSLSCQVNKCYLTHHNSMGKRSRNIWVCVGSVGGEMVRRCPSAAVLTCSSPAQDLARSWYRSHAPDPGTLKQGASVFFVPPSFYH